MLPLHRRETTSPSYETESLLPCFSLSFSLFLSFLFLSLHQSIRSSFSTLLVVSSFSIPRTTSPRRYRFHIRSVSVPFKSSDRFRLSYPTENRKSSRPLFPPTNTRAHTHVSNRPDFVLSFLQVTSPPPPLRCSTVRSIARPAHTVILFHYFLIERLLLVLFDCSFYILQRRSYSTVSFSHVHLGIFPSLPFRTFSGVVFLRECARVACISVFVKLDVARHQVRCFVREAFEDLAGFAVGIEIKPTGFHD